MTFLASALKCWECNESQQDCRDEFNAAKLVGKVNQEKCEGIANDPVVCVKVKKTSK